MIMYFNEIENYAGSNVVTSQTGFNFQAKYAPINLVVSIL